jgi:hypothetical protein
LPSGIPGTLEAGKIAPQANPVNSGMRTGAKECRSIRRCDYASIFAKHRGKSVGAVNFSFSLRDARFLFLVKKNFFAIQKIKFIFFLSISKRVSSLKPAGEDENKAHVNKL